MAKFYKIIFCVLLATTCNSQTVYFRQDFSGTGPFVSTNPNIGQFSHLIKTIPGLSYHEFHNGFMDLIRSRQDSATGGIIRVLRATPFVPNPETLFIQIKMSVEEMQSVSPSAMYFYVGENFRTTNNSFPANTSMFSRFSIAFQGTSFVLKDVETQTFSNPMPLRTPVTLTWVLNNSVGKQSYKINKASNAEKFVMPGTYDLWIDGQAFKLNVPAYPADSPFSTNKLTNFEMRFRNGIGKIRIYDLLITDVKESLVQTNGNSSFVNPNPSSAQLLHLKAANIDSHSVKLMDSRGRLVPVKVDLQGNEANIRPQEFLPSGIYIILYEEGKVRKSVKIIVD